MSIRVGTLPKSDASVVALSTIRLEQLTAFYSAEISAVIKGLDTLWPRYYKTVDSKTYACDRAKVRFVAACVAEGTMDTYALERSLDYLAKQQHLMEASQLSVSTPTAARDFQLQCQPTGQVKAFKKMGQQQVEKRNSQLSNDKSSYRWVRVPAASSS